MQLSTPLSEALSTKKEYIKALSDMGLKTIEDLLLYFPRAYEDLSEFKPLHEAKDGEVITTKGFLQGIKLIPTKNRKMKLVKAMFYDQTGYESEAVWFNQPHLLRTLPMDKEVVVSGKVKWNYGKITLQGPVVEKSKATQIHAGTTVPTYPQHDVITSKWLREKIHPLLYLTKDLPEVLPDEILEAEKLMPKSLAVQEIHFPSSQEKLEAAQDRLGYEELFLLQLKSLKAKKEWQDSRPASSEDEGMPLDPEFVKAFFATLPFTPTNAQKIVIYEILKDMEKPLSYDAPFRRRCGFW